MTWKTNNAALRNYQKYEYAIKRVDGLFWDGETFSSLKYAIADVPTITYAEMAAQLKITSDKVLFANCEVVKLF